MTPDVTASKIPPSQFLREISWVAPQYVASEARPAASSTGADGGDGGSTNKNQTTGPGLHGTGLNATVYGNVTLSPTASNRLTYVKGQAFQVVVHQPGRQRRVQRQGHAEDRARERTGSPITLNKTVPQIAKGEKATVELPLNREPAAGRGRQRST